MCAWTIWKVTIVYREWLSQSMDHQQPHQKGSPIGATACLTAFRSGRTIVNVKDYGFFRRPQFYVGNIGLKSAAPPWVLILMSFRSDW